MNKFEAIEAINLHSGNVELDEDQARRRAHNIKEVEEGIFNIINPIQFKIGEKFGYDGEVSKTLAQSLDGDVKVEENEDTQAKKETQDKESAYPVHLGGPWYKLSSGEKVQGKQDAEDAEYLLGE